MAVARCSWGTGLCGFPANRRPADRPVVVESTRDSHSTGRGWDGRATDSDVGKISRNGSSEPTGSKSLPLRYGQRFLSITSESV